METVIAFVVAVEGFFDKGKERVLWLRRSKGYLQD